MLLCVICRHVNIVCTCWCWWVSICLQVCVYISDLRVLWADLTWETGLQSPGASKHIQHASLQSFTHNNISCQARACLLVLGSQSSRDRSKTSKPQCIILQPVGQIEERGMAEGWGGKPLLGLRKTKVVLHSEQSNLSIKGDDGKYLIIQFVGLKSQLNLHDRVLIH